MTISIKQRRHFEVAPLFIDGFVVNDGAVKVQGRSRNRPRDGI